MMRATIDITEQKRFLRPPIFMLTCEFEFTQVELAVIRERRMGSGLVYDQFLDPYSPREGVPKTMKEVMKHGITTGFRTAVHAAQYRAHLEETVLPYIKDFIEISAAVPQQGPRTIVL
jgi:hypothetical protein